MEKWGGPGASSYFSTSFSVLNPIKPEQNRITAVKKPSIALGF